MSLKDLKTLEKAVYLFKQYEYGKLKEYPGVEVDKLMKECKEYNSMLKKLRQKIEKKMQEKTAEEIYDGVFKLLSTLFGKKPVKELLKEFENKMIKKGKIQTRFSNILKELVLAKNKIKSGKMNQKEVDSVKRDAIELMNALVEYGQRADLIEAEKGAMRIIYSGRKAELVLLGSKNFLIEGKDVRKIESGKLLASSREEFEKAFAENSGKMHTQVSGEVFEVLHRELGKFEVEF